MKKLLCLALCLMLALSLSSCFGQTDSKELWDSATYKSDTELGEGSKTVYVEVTVEENSITFTIHTDEAILGDALIAHGLVEGEEGPYGLYIKKVNGITADYDVDQSYWGFYKNGEYMLTGVDSTEFANGDHYELVYSK